MSAEPLRVALTYSVDLELQPGDEAWLEASCGLESVDAVEAACREAGWETRRIPVDDDLSATVAALETPRPDVVFSMVESVRNDARLETAMAFLMEWLEIPYTGAPALALSVALHKPLARAVLESAGLAVPAGAVLEEPNGALGGLRYPVIVKPAREDGSIGIVGASVAADEAAARERVRHVLEHFRQPALVEEFVDGREFAISVLGPTDAPRVLPHREIDYDGPAGTPRLLSYDSKWIEGTSDYRHTTSVTAEVDGELAERLDSIGRLAYRAIGLRDYGRVDVRLDSSDEPLVVDVNPNPELLPGRAGIAAAAKDAGVSFTELVTFIVEQAVARGASRD